MKGNQSQDFVDDWKDSEASSRRLIDACRIN